MVETKFMPIDLKLAISPPNENGESEEAVIVIVEGSFLPSPQGPIPLVTGTYQIPLNKEVAKKLGEGLIELSEQLAEPKLPSKLIVANSTAGVDEAIKVDKKFRGR